MTDSYNSQWSGDIPPECTCFCGNEALPSYHQHRQDFIQALLTDYDSRIPPNFEKDYPCEVNVSLYISSIDSIDEETMEFTISTFVSQEWVDDRLQFRNLIVEEYLELDARLMENVWVPDLYFRNEKRAYFHEITTPNRMLHIYQDGTVKYRSRLTLTAACPMKLHKYPMDKQKCSLFIQSFAYSTKRLTFNWLEPEPLKMDQYFELPQFAVVMKETINCTDIMEGNTCKQMNLYLERNIGYYMIHLYVPSVLIVMLSWLSFWLHVDAVPARVSLGILTVLTMTTQRSMSNSSLPRVSYVKAIDVWMAVCLCFVVAALIEYACANVLQRNRNTKIQSLQYQFKECKTGLVNGKSHNRPPYGLTDSAHYVDNCSKLAFPIFFLMFCVFYWSFYVLAQ